jgi:hypothetical protein
LRILTATLLLALSLAGCGGGGGGGSTQLAPAWQSGVFQPAASFADKCAMPRGGTDPFNNNAPYPDRAGSVLYENNWLRSWTNDLYLWFDEVIDQDPASYSTALAYFDVLKTNALTPSGADKDRFHFTYPTADWNNLASAGVQAGYGPQWAIVSSRPPRNVVVAYLDPGATGTATDPTLLRGATVVSVDGERVIDGSNSTTLNNGLFPATAGESHTFEISDQGATATRLVTLVSAKVHLSPVMSVGTIVPASGPGLIGYILFNNHLGNSESAMIDAISTLKNAGVTDLVLDIRYNGGGFLDVASEVAYMIAGAGPTTGQTFDLTRFNSKHPTIDPVNNVSITPTPFFTSSTTGQALPTLNLSRVFVLTGPDTCSASEAIINGLRGVNVGVIQIGSTTCGKPYGFYPQDNCGTTYFTIEFEGVNDMNIGGYTDGFSPDNTPATQRLGVSLPGCSVADDFTHQLGDSAEARLSQALAYRQNGGSCTVPASGFGKALRAQSSVDSGPYLPASPLRALTLLRRRS